MSLRWGGGVLLEPYPKWELRDGALLCSKLDFERCIRSVFGWGLCERGLIERLPVDVAPLRRLTSGFSMGQGRGILETQGVSGDGGQITGERGGPEMMPAATLWMSLSHLSHRLRLRGGRCSISGVESGLPGGSVRPSGKTIAEVDVLRVSSFSVDTFTSLVGILAFTSISVMVPWVL